MEELREEVGEFQEEAGGELAKEWAGQVDRMEKNKTKTDMGGLCEDRFNGSERGMENDSEGGGGRDK